MFVVFAPVALSSVCPSAYPAARVSVFFSPLRSASTETRTDSELEFPRVASAVAVMAPDHRLTGGGLGGGAAGGSATAGFVATVVVGCDAGCVDACVEGCVAGW